MTALVLRTMIIQKFHIFYFYWLPLLDRPMPMFLENIEVLARNILLLLVYFVDQNQNYHKHVLGVVFNSDSNIFKLTI